jgi:hypothetical protein
MEGCRKYRDLVRVFHRRLKTLKTTMTFANWVENKCRKSATSLATESDADSLCGRGKHGSSSKRTIIHVETLANSSTVITISAIDP